MTEYSKKIVTQTLFGLFFIAVFFYHLISSYPWMYLNALALVLCFLHIRVTKISLPPKYGANSFCFIVFIFALTSLLNGSHFVEERWLMRYTFLFLTFIFLSVFKTDDDLHKNLKIPFTVFVGLVCGEALLQYFFLYTFDAPLSHSTHSSRFWNIVHYSEAALVSIVLISQFKDSASGLALYFYDFLIAALMISIFVGFSKVAILGLGIFMVIYFLKAGTLKNRLKVLCILIFCVAFSFFLNKYKNGYTTEFAQIKTNSANFRMNVWKKTIQMALDNPTGVGTNNFTFSLFSYTDDGKNSDQAQEMWYSPHSEILRIFAEEGLGCGIAYCLTLLLFSLFSLYQILIKKNFQPLCVLFLTLLPQIFFQFPSEMYLTVFIFAIFLALFINKISDKSMPLRMPVKVVLVLGMSLNLVFWIVRNNKIVPTTYSKQFCGLFHDDWLMCRKYFIEHYSAGEMQKADEVVKSIVKYQPYNLAFLALDYSLDVQPRSSMLVCMYYNLFNGQKKIPESNTDKCIIEKDKSKMRALFLEYKEKR